MGGVKFFFSGRGDGVGRVLHEGHVGWDREATGFAVCIK